MKRNTLALLVTIIALTTGCQSDNTTNETTLTSSEQTVSEQIVAENIEETQDEFSEYTDTKEIFNNFKTEPIGDDGYEVYCAYDRYAIVYAYNGILIYDFENKQICGGIDNGALGMDYIQGENAFCIVSDKADENVFLYEFSDIMDGGMANGYKYSISKKTLDYVENEPLDNYVSHLDWVMDFSAPDTQRPVTEYMKLQEKFCNSEENTFDEYGFIIEGVGARPRENDIVVFAYGHDTDNETERKFKIYTITKESFDIIDSYDFEIEL